MGLPFAMNPTELKRQIIQRGFEQVLNDAKIPQRVHLKVIEALTKRIEEHDAFSREYQEDSKRHQQILGHHERQIQNWNEVARHLTSIDKLQGEKGEQGERGEPGMDAETPDLDQLVSVILGKIPAPKDGKHGKDAVVDENAIVEQLISRLKKDKPLDISHIRNAQTFIKDGIRYKVEELMKGGGNSTGVSFTVMMPTGTVNGFNTSFTFTTAPSVIVLDNGNAMNKISADGTVNWTGTTSVVLSQAPNFNIYGY